MSLHDSGVRVGAPAVSAAPEGASIRFCIILFDSCITPSTPYSHLQYLHHSLDPCITLSTPILIAAIHRRPAVDQGLHEPVR